MRVLGQRIRVRHVLKQEVAAEHDMVGLDHQVEQEPKETHDSLKRHTDMAMSGEVYVRHFGA